MSAENSLYIKFIFKEPDVNWSKTASELFFLATGENFYTISVSQFLSSSTLRLDTKLSCSIKSVRLYCVHETDIRFESKQGPVIFLLTIS